MDREFGEAGIMDVEGGYLQMTPSVAESEDDGEKVSDRERPEVHGKVDGSFSNDAIEDIDQG